MKNMKKIAKMHMRLILKAHVGQINKVNFDCFLNLITTRTEKKD